MQQRTAESERLPGAGAGLAYQVSATQGQRDGDRLDGKRMDDARRGECTRDFFSDTEVCEGLGSGSCLAQDENLTVRQTLLTADSAGRQSREEVYPG